MNDHVDSSIYKSLTKTTSGVTAPGKQVKSGTPTELICSVTEVAAAVTITWWDDTDTEITDSTSGKYSARELQG